MIAQTNPAYAGNDREPIPDDAIRIRIIAQSDSAADQAIKRGVRDRMAALIESWGKMPTTEDEAKAFLKARLPEVRKVADEALKAQNAPYGASIDLDEVPFPAKTFQGKAYPAGKYEALRITLGKGDGANWWCVLFPPLCLTAATAKDDADEAKSADTHVATAKTNAKSGSVHATEAVGKADARTVAAMDGKTDAAAPEKPHAEFFLIVILKKLIAWIASLFS
ncbi:stage II sporulation protein R [Cohnella zeiphila]|uniref:Stage II sporulation protein R n=1 Tax=Cohnella zeiphila TaxID=2761120 RepID=A0A7X0VWZ3_9BACL|nr:stage II sporulation protein R [Cohnella zeiphila]MBB6733015.1 stage II sporulation protein R [Cohnella zeiphila]